jgi:hypothetical protein
MTLEDFINEKIRERTEAAIQKATTRTTPYMFKDKNLKNCLATALNNWYNVPPVWSN